MHGPDRRLPNDHHYDVTWSDEDNEFVCLAAEFPSLSCLTTTPHEALSGIRAHVLEVLCDTGAVSSEQPPAGRLRRSPRSLVSHVQQVWCTSRLTAPSVATLIGEIDGHRASFETGDRLFPLPGRYQIGYG